MRRPRWVRRPRRPAPWRLVRQPLESPNPRRLLALTALLVASAAPRVALSALGVGILLDLLGRAVQHNRFEDQTGNPFTDQTQQPIWQGFDTQWEPPSVTNLSRTLDINGTTVEPTFWYKGSDASGTTWTPEVGGAAGLLTEAGSGASPSYSQGTPLMGSDAAVKYNTAKYHQAAGSLFGDITTDDFVIEMVVRPSGTANVRPLCKRSSGTNLGYELYFTTTSLGLYLNDGTGIVSSNFLSPAFTANAWYHLILFVDRSGSAIAYLDASPGTAVNVSGVQLSLASTLALKIGNNAADSAPFDGAISHVAMWKSANWLDTHLQATLAAQRFRSLAGARPQISSYGRDAAPVTMSRNSCATIEKYNAATSSVEYHTVGEHWPPVCSWWDGTRVVIGARSEETRTNSQQDSHDLNLWSSVSFGAIAAAASPIAGIRAWTYSENSGTSAHFIYNNGVSFTAGTVYTASVLVRPNGRSWFALRVANGAGGVSWCSYNVTTGAVGGSASAAGSMESVGSGAYRLSMTWTHSTTEVRVVVFLARDADSASDPYLISYLGSGAAAFDATAAQVEAGEVASSIIETSAAAGAQRLKDELEYGITGMPGAQGCVIVDAIVRSSSIPVTSVLVDASDGGVTNRSLLYLSTAEKAAYNVGVGGVSGGATNIADGVLHRYALNWHPGRVELWLDGAQDAVPDTVFTPPGVMNQVAIGMAFNNANQPSAPVLIKNVRIYNTYQNDLDVQGRLAA